MSRPVLRTPLCALLGIEYPIVLASMESRGRATPPALVAAVSETMRSFKNVVIDAWDRAGLPPLPMPFQKVLMDDFNEAAARAGRWDLVSNPAGQVAGRVRERKPAARIVAELVEGAIEAVDRLCSATEPVAAGR
jgi:NAD(P)H-dependent flavin oxidoreductase YrpB (nitropropane dioxygenase family)